METKTTRTEKLEDCVSASSCQNHPFTAWELEFIDDTAEQLRVYRTLSPKQWDTIEKIWDKI